MKNYEMGIIGDKTLRERYFGESPREQKQHKICIKTSDNHYYDQCTFASGLNSK